MKSIDIDRNPIKSNSEPNLFLYNLAQEVGDPANTHV